MPFVAWTMRLTENHRPRVATPRAQLIAVALLLLMTGCSELPNQPRPSFAPSPPTLVIASDGAVSYRQASELAHSGSASLKVSHTIDGSQGGWIRCGRLFLVVSAGAFDSLATITMSMNDSTEMVVNLEIEPASRNDFKASVSLGLNTTGLQVSPDSIAMYWLDPQRMSWTGISTDRDMATVNSSGISVSEKSGCEVYDESNTSSGVWTPLQHFSTYSAGKAGW